MEHTGIHVFRCFLFGGILAFYIRAHFGAFSRLEIAEAIAIGRQAVSIRASGVRFHIWF